MSLSEAELTQQWKTLVHARATLNDARLGAPLAHQDLLRVIEELVAVMERLWSSYDAQYAHLQQARDLLGEVASAAPVESSREGQEGHTVSQDLVLRTTTFLRYTEPRDSIG